MQLLKDSSWSCAMAVYNCFDLINGDGSDRDGLPSSTHMLAHLTQIGQQSAIRVSEEISGRHAWVCQSRTSDNIVIWLAQRDQIDTAAGFLTPHLHKAKQVYLQFDEIFEAAKLMHDFIELDITPAVA